MDSRLNPELGMNGGGGGHMPSMQGYLQSADMAADYLGQAGEEFKSDD